MMCPVLCSPRCHHEPESVTRLSLDSAERVLIHFILLFTRNSRQSMKETTKNFKKHRQDMRNSCVDTKATTGPTRPTPPLDFLHAKPV